MKNICHDKRKLCRDRKQKSNETSQDKLVATKISMLQQTVQLAIKIKEGNMLQHFSSLSRHKVHIPQCKTTRLCHDKEVLCHDNNNMQL